MNKPICVVQAPVDTRSGYGDHARDLAHSLIRLDKYDVKIIPTPWGGTPRTALDVDTEDNKKIRERFLTGPLQRQPELHIQVTIPNEFNPQGQFNIGITAGIESDLCRAEWIEGMNKMNMNIVPSVHAKDVFERSKFKKKEKNGVEVPLEYTKPIEVLFEGSDLEIYGKDVVVKDDAVDEVFSEIKEDFVFLFVGHWLQGKVGADRKDIGMLIRTFTEAFKNQKKKPALLLKTSGATFAEMDKDSILKKIKDAQNGIEGDLPNVYLLHGELTPEQINYLYNHKKVKAHASLTHGEGYGRPLQEASLSGKPVIASGWSGHVDFLPKDLAVLIPGQLKPVHGSAANEWIIKESKWFVANYSVVAQRMTDMFNNYSKYTDNAKKLADKNKKEKSLEAMDVEFGKILDKYVPEFTQQVGINLPKLKKAGGASSAVSLPKLKKVGDKAPTAAIKLPKLKKKE
jgi:hypothetical protein